MRAFILIFSILAILVFIFSAEYFIIESFFDDLRYESEKLRDEIVQDGDIGGNVNGIISMWEKRKGALYIFENHNYFKSLEENVYKLRYYVNNNEQRNILFTIDCLITIADESEYDFSLMPGNIL